MNKYKNYNFLGENSKNLGLILNERNNNIEKDFQSLVSPSDHNLLIYKLNKKLDYVGYNIIDKKQALLNSSKVINQIFEGKNMKYEKKVILIKDGKKG